MKKTSIIFSFVLGLILIASCKNLYAAPSIKWENSFKKAKELAKKENKIIMIDLYTDWCGWCKELDKRTFTGKEVIESSKKLIALKLNAETTEEGKALVKEYKVQGYPTIVFIDKDGKLLKKVVGFLEAPQFNEEMTKSIAIPGAIAKIKSQTKPTLEALNTYIEIGDVDGGDKIFTELIKDNIIPKQSLPFYYLELGYLYLDNVKMSLAKNYFDKILKDYSTSEQVYAADYYIGYILVSENKKNEAKTHLEKAIKRPGVPNKTILEKMLADIK